MLAESGLLHQLTQIMPHNQPGVQIYSLYGDPAYPQSQYLVGDYRNPAPNSIEVQWNTAMSKVRISVEWGFKEITQVWTFFQRWKEMMFMSGSSTHLIRFHQNHFIRHISTLDTLRRTQWIRMKRKNKRRFFL
jgi:hypothetical protein